MPVTRRRDLQRVPMRRRCRGHDWQSVQEASLPSCFVHAWTLEFGHKWSTPSYKSSPRTSRALFSLLSLPPTPTPPPTYAPQPICIPAVSRSRRQLDSRQFVAYPNPSYRYCITPPTFSLRVTPPNFLFASTPSQYPSLALENSYPFLSRSALSFAFRYRTTRS